MYEDIFPKYRRIVIEDTEFVARPGERPEPICAVFRELRTRETVRLFRGEFGVEPPFPLDDPSTLLVAFYASAELQFNRMCRWVDGADVCDPFIEFRNLTNGRPLPHGSSLVGAMAYLGYPYPYPKETLTSLIERGNWDRKDERFIVDCCEVDVDATERLLLWEYSRIDPERAIYRGTFPSVAADMEWLGLPMNMRNLIRVRDRWDDLKDMLIGRIDRNYRVYGGSDGRSFLEAAFERYLADKEIPWARRDDGHLALDDRTFRQMGKAYPKEIGPLRELRHALSQLRLGDLAVGSDGRARTLTSYYRARTGRSQPSNTKSPFGTSVWIRFMLQAPPGWGLLASDYAQQEVGTGAGLSGDPVLQRAYNLGDPYLGFAVEARAIPRAAAERYVARREAKLEPDDDDSKAKVVRELYKPVVLSIQYGRGGFGLAQTLDIQPIRARVLLDKHREAFSVFWAWSDARVRYAFLERHTSTVMGWNLWVPDEHVEEGKGPLKNKTVITGPNVRSLMNFAMQANAAEMTRLAACLAAERKIEVLLTVHDALIAQAPITRLAETAKQLEECMIEASSIILDGFKLRVDTKLIPHPHHYHDDRGEDMWQTVMQLLDELECGGRAVA